MIDAASPIAAPQEPAPQPKGEPVAYRIKLEPWQSEKTGDEFTYSTKSVNGMWQPLYASPVELRGKMRAWLKENQYAMSVEAGESLEAILAEGD